MAQTLAIPGLADTVASLDIDQSYLREVIGRLTAIGSTSMGFRTTGTPEDAAVAEYVRGEMLTAGLNDIAVEDVPVDGWRFRGAWVDTTRSHYVAVSFGGVPGTGPEGISGPLVDVGSARRRRLDRLDCAGAIALLDWVNDVADPASVALELRRRGVVGVVLNCPAGGPWYQRADALGGFDGHWPAGGPPMALISASDAADLRSGRADDGAPVTIGLQVESTPGARGHNVVGYLPGARPGPIVVGAHHDAWFRGAFDNTSGVAALLALARSLVESQVTLRHTVCFTSRTGEEYGRADSTYDWCVGAWEQIHTTHPGWSHEAPFHLCLEASGHRELRSVVEAPAELAGWARTVCRESHERGWLPTGWRVAPPVAGTEQWPYLVSGVPGVAAYSWEKSFGRTDYHTQFDTDALLDYGHLAGQTRSYALLLLAADADPDGILDHRARARQLDSIARRHSHPGLRTAAAAHRNAQGRRAFTPVGRALFALDAHGRFRAPHAQSETDLTHLRRAVTALDSGDRAAAARSLTAVGNLALSPYLSHESYLEYTRRLARERTDDSWAGASHLTAAPDLWAELAALRGDSGGRPFGAWVRASLGLALEAVEHELDRRLTAIAEAI